jgi:hypothetical protein
MILNALLFFLNFLSTVIDDGGCDHDHDDDDDCDEVIKK